MQYLFNGPRINAKRLHTNTNGAMVFETRVLPQYIWSKKKSFTEHVGQMAKYHNLYAVAKKYYTRRIPNLDVKKYVFHFKVSIISPNIFRTIYNTYLLLNITHETQCSNCRSHIYQLRQEFYKRHISVKLCSARIRMLQLCVGRMGLTNVIIIRKLCVFLSLVIYYINYYLPAQIFLSHTCRCAWTTS